MAKLTAGQTMPDFTYDTPFASGRTLTETVQKVEGKTALVFLRYYGCTLCQLDIRQFSGFSFPMCLRFSFILLSLR